MIGRQQRATALASIVLAHGRYGTKAFRVDRRGDHWQPLHDAAGLGWCWWPGDDRCALLPAAEALAAEYAGGDNGSGA